MLPPLQQYTVQAVALETTAPGFRVYASPAGPIPPEGIELNPLVSFGVAVCPGPEAATLWESLHERAGKGELTVTDRHAPPRTPWCATVHHRTKRQEDTATAAQLGALEGRMWAMVDIMAQGKAGE